MIYLYDGTFDSLLNLINYLFRNKIKPLNIKDSFYVPSLLEKTYYPTLKLDIKLSSRIIDKIGYKAFMTICHTYLSNDENKELYIYDFLLNSLKYKTNIIYMRNLDSVNKCLKLSSYVTREAHRLKGFVRFHSLDNGALCAFIEPENDVLIMLSNHFKNRLRNEYWIIVDKKRKILSYYDKNNFYIMNEDMFNYKLELKEDNIEDLWKEFYKTIGIKERKNDRCRMNFMPKKYWKYIVEVKNEKNN